MRSPNPRLLILSPYHCLTAVLKYPRTLKMQTPNVTRDLITPTAFLYSPSFFDTLHHMYLIPPKHTPNIWALTLAPIASHAHGPHTTVSPLHLKPSPYTFRSSSDSPHKIKSSAYKRLGNLLSLLSSRNITPILPISFSPLSSLYLYTNWSAKGTWYNLI